MAVFDDVATGRAPQDPGAWRELRRAFPGGARPELRRVPRGAARGHDHDSEVAGPRAALHAVREFLDAVSEDRDPTRDTAGARVVRVLEAAQRSLENGGAPERLSQCPLRPASPRPHPEHVPLADEELGRAAAALAVERARLCSSGWETRRPSPAAALRLDDVAAGEPAQVRSVAMAPLGVPERPSEDEVLISETCRALGSETCSRGPARQPEQAAQHGLRVHQVLEHVQAEDRVEGPVELLQRPSTGAATTSSYCARASSACSGTTSIPVSRVGPAPAARPDAARPAAHVEHLPIGLAARRRCRLACLRSSPGPARGGRLAVGAWHTAAHASQRFDRDRGPRRGDARRRGDPRLRDGALAHRCGRRDACCARHRAARAGSGAPRAVRARRSAAAARAFRGGRRGDHAARPTPWSRAGCVPRRRASSTTSAIRFPSTSSRRRRRRRASGSCLWHTIALDHFLAALHSGHHFICSGRRQRDLYVGALLASRLIHPAAYRADPSFRSFLEQVPFGIPAEPPQRVEGAGPRARYPEIGEDAQIVLWNGGIWNWLDPVHGRGRNGESGRALPRCAAGVHVRARRSRPRAARGARGASAGASGWVRSTGSCSSTRNPFRTRSGRRG